MNILVLCTGNSARSILLEGILSDLGYDAYSAGSSPVGKVHPEALKTLSRHDIQLDAPRSKSWDVFSASDSPEMDLVITVCGNAANEACPFWPGAPLQVHWGVEDPAAVEGPDQAAAFEAAYHLLAKRARAFHDLSPNERQPDQIRAIGSLT